ncbi:thiamine phosphate synthase [Xanthobacter agilis]|uniref:Thiamine-phosphate pyrophosphorylase n=1 Tax=Xanthobacter agilis TaxID=47492 RepID=A0ABU0L845_XANAG|nr:thiamine phosphate synthase [Xanthobacter agilis]MDQ0503296.1 thiamine-phosphate pyrophosphorylase [Xanthobacter agilis]
MSQSALPPRARLMLILPSALPPQDAVALAAAGDVAAAVIRPAEKAPSAAQLRALAQPLQQRDCAVLVEDKPELVAAAGLDGAHADDAALLAKVLKQLKPDGIVGAGGLFTRHAAMEAGESGADYVLFGALAGGDDFARTRALVEWWSPLFEVPCAAVATSLPEVEALANAGADFIVLGEGLLRGADGVAAVRAAQAAIDTAKVTAGTPGDEIAGPDDAP